MPLHLTKLCVGVASIGELEAEIAGRLDMLRLARRPAEQIHTTRMVPKRITTMAEAGSLFWVIKGQLCARQRLIDIRPFTDIDGIGRCHLVLHPEIVPVLPAPVVRFKVGATSTMRHVHPISLGRSPAAADMPEHLRHALRDLCLL